MFISTDLYHPRKSIMINLDNVEYIEDDRDRTIFRMKSGLEVLATAKMGELADILSSYEKKKVKIETGTVNVKVVNPR